MRQCQQQPHQPRPQLDNLIYLLEQNTNHWYTTLHCPVFSVHLLGGASQPTSCKFHCITNPVSARYLPSETPLQLLSAQLLLTRLFALL